MTLCLYVFDEDAAALLSRMFALFVDSPGEMCVSALFGVISHWHFPSEKDPFTSATWVKVSIWTT